MSEQLIVDWFDVNDLEHLKAFRELGNTGCWPVGFIPKGMQFPNGWQIILYGMLGNAYLNAMLPTQEGE